jgi:hypothetical protein
VTTLPPAQTGPPYLGAWAGVVSCDVTGSFLGQGTKLNTQAVFSLDSGTLRLKASDYEPDFNCRFEWAAECTAEGACGGGGTTIVCQNVKAAAWVARCGEVPYPQVSRAVFCAKAGVLGLSEYSPTCSPASGEYKRPLSRG